VSRKYSLVGRRKVEESFVWPFYKFRPDRQRVRIAPEGAEAKAILAGRKQFPGTN
jgi:hypothetical protein